MALTRISENPFYILELPSTATRTEIERAGQKLLSMLSLTLEAASVYPTPLGLMQRTEDQVRWAMHELRDPALRVQHRFWAALPPHPQTPPASPQDLCLPDAIRDLGWPC